MGFTETFLDKSKPAELSGYVQIARLDRRTGEKCGGIILFAKKGFDHAIVHVGDSEKHERSWFVVRLTAVPFFSGYGIVGRLLARQHPSMRCMKNLNASVKAPFKRLLWATSTSTKSVGSNTQTAALWKDANC